MSPGAARTSACSTVSAGLLILAFPRADLNWVAPVALAPLIWALRGETLAKRRFWIAYAAGVVYWFGVCYWIRYTLAEHAGVSGAVAWALFLLFCVAKAVQMGVFGVAVGFLRGPVALAALWTVLEWTHNYTGFAWLVLGNAALGWPGLERLAPWTGVWGLSFVLALVAAVAVEALRKPRALLWLAVIPLLWILPPLPARTNGDARALAVQPNIADETAWTDQLVAALDRHLAELSVPREPVNIAVWPEVPAPVYDNDPMLPSIAQRAHAEFLAGVVSHTDRGEPLNSALLIAQDGRVISKYDKVNLVPFGEFVPWPFDVIVKKISTEAGDFAPGKGVVVADRIGTFICYESVFPHYIRKFAREGAEVLFNLSNDSWFGKSAARYQHFSIVRMRAAENRRWIVRVTNNGITASIDPAGRVMAQEPEYREATAVLPYGRETARTFYTQHGDWFIWVCVVVCAVGTRLRVS